MAKAKGYQTRLATMSLGYFVIQSRSALKVESLVLDDRPNNDQEEGKRQNHAPVENCD
jgi:uncharacterized protein